MQLEEWPGDPGVINMGGILEGKFSPGTVLILSVNKPVSRSAS
ncbi:hypothetical protein ES703_99779 [subsurface metagenome]